MYNSCVPPGVSPPPWSAGDAGGVVPPVYGYTLFMMVGTQYSIKRWVLDDGDEKAFLVSIPTMRKRFVDVNNVEWVLFSWPMGRLLTVRPCFKFLRNMQLVRRKCVNLILCHLFTNKFAKRLTFHFQKNQVLFYVCKMWRSQNPLAIYYIKQTHIKNQAR